MKNKIKKFLFFSAITTLSLHTINKIISSISTIKNLLSKEKGDYYKWRFGNIFYTKQGSGPSVLLIHDLNSYSSSVEWEEVIKSLSTSYTVYTLDLPGCGRSDKPIITYTNYLYVQMISDFIKNVICHKTNVIATGYSSSFTAMACYNENELFDKIIFINPSDLNKLRQIPGKRNKSFKLMMNIPILGTSIYNSYHSKKNIEHLFGSQLFYNTNKIKPKYIDKYYEAAHLNNVSARFLFSSIQAKYTNTNVIHALKSINNSIIIIAGSELPGNAELVQNYVCYNPAVETVIIHDCKKLPQLEKPIQIIEYINTFLS